MPKNKKEILEIKVQSQNERMHYFASCEDNEVISIDYLQPIGDEKGYTSLELLLIALTSCILATVGGMLRSRNIKIRKIDADAKGYRRSEHPTGFENILVNIIFHSNDLTAKDVDKVIKIAESTVCPVWCMMKNLVKIEVTYEIKD